MNDKEDINSPELTDEELSRATRVTAEQHAEFHKAVEEHKRERTPLEKQVDAEIIAEAEHLVNNPEELKKHVDAIENDPEAIHIPGKKDKKLTPKSFYCSTCREWFLEDKADKRPMGFDRSEDGTILATASRFSIFCPSCAKFISIQDPETDAKIKNAIDKVGNK
jgi:hypothetical protein